MFRVVLLMAVVIVAIQPQPFVQFCLVERRVVVAQALEIFSCWLDDVTLALTLLAFDAAVGGQCPDDFHGGDLGAGRCCRWTGPTFSPDC